LRMNKETALSLALASKSADGAVRILIDRTSCWMCVCALRVFAGSAILTLDSARALPRKLLSRCICGHGVFVGRCRARGRRCTWWRHHGQQAWVWNEQHARRRYSRRSRQATASRRWRRRFEKARNGRRRFHHRWSPQRRRRRRRQPGHHAREPREPWPSSEPWTRTVWKSHPCLGILGREYHAST